MDEDESLSTLLAMGFPDIGEIKRALRLAKNDLSEAVAILTNEQPSNAVNNNDCSNAEVYGPVNMPGPSLGDVEMGDDAVKSMGLSSGGEAKAYERQQQNLQEESTDTGFPVTNFYELERRVFQDNWSIPYKREESLGKCLLAATRLVKEGKADSDEHCQKFLSRVLPEALRKLLTSSATQRWQTEIQEGIYDMMELFVDLSIAGLKSADEVPVPFLQMLAMCFDMKNDWNNKNRDRLSRGKWQTGSASSSKIDFAQAPRDSFTRATYGWLCDLINLFGDKGGFDLVSQYFDSNKLDCQHMSALLAPFANCVELLVKQTVQRYLWTWVDKSFTRVKELDIARVKGREVMAISDLIVSLKLVCLQFWPEHVKDCDQQRLTIICKMLKAPQFSSKMNALKEVSRLIDECNQRNRKNISTDQVVDWMAENSVLSVALEGNIDQVQYTERIKAIVEFLGPRLSNEELAKMWQLQESANVHVAENIFAIMAGASCKFSLSQFEHLTSLIRDTWEKSNDRVREKLLMLIGQIGRDAKQIKSTQAILQLLWEVSHIKKLPRNLQEKALSEHITILTEMTVSRDVMKKTYILKCVEDIRKNNAYTVMAVKHLHDICKSYSRSTSVYLKADKASLGDLNKQHEIVKLLSQSLSACHKRSVETAESSGVLLNKDSLVYDTYTHSEVVDAHLALMQFFLKEGDLYLSWSRCEELWQTLVENPKVIPEDKEKIFTWFMECLTDIDGDTQIQFFESKLLSLKAFNVSRSSFLCFKSFFESVNITKGNLKKSMSPPLIVDTRGLAGLPFLWQIVTDCQEEPIADQAINYLLNMSFTYLNSKLKGQRVQLHQDFISSCYRKLQLILSSSENRGDAVQEGHELETSISSDRTASQALLAISVSNVSSLPVSIRGRRLQQTTRILLLAERYISSIEETFPANRSILPHAATFHGKKVDIKVVTDSKKDEFILESHSNEMVSDVKSRIAEVLKLSQDRLSVHFGDVELCSTKDRCLVGSLASSDITQTWVAKAKKNVTSSSTALVLFQDEPSSSTPPASSTDTISSLHNGSNKRSSSYLEEEERSLPGVVMASGGQVFTLLYQLASLGDKRIVQAARRLINLIPTDPAVEEVLDLVAPCSEASQGASAEISPKLSPRVKKSEGSHFPLGRNTMDIRGRLSRLFEASGEGMNPFRVLYNLEVLSARILPTRKVSSSAHQEQCRQAEQDFSTSFLNNGGLRLILNVMERNSMPADVDYDIRQSSYLVALQLADHLLCGHIIQPVIKPVTSPVIKPTPPKRSALDSTATATKSPVVISATKIVQTMSDEEFVETISCLTRVVWAAAAGNLTLATAGIQSVKQGDHPRFYLGRRSRDSSTGSSSSEGSSSLADPTVLHAGVCAQQRTVSRGDCQIAEEAFDLLVTCLQMRSNHIISFFNLPLINEFIIDTVLGSASLDVRQRARDQLVRLSKLRVTARSLNLDEAGNVFSPRQHLTKLLLRTPVPLWMPSCKARGISHSILGQCTEYFDLRCSLLRALTKKEQEAMDVSAASMIEDELTFLHNFAPCQRRTDCTLLAGHIRLVEALLTCEDVDKQGIGARLIPDILASFLFPASQLIHEGPLSNNGVNIAKDVSPKCDTSQSRVAAYNLLVELSKMCSSNVALIATELIRMHHSFNENLLKEFEFSPAVERRGESNFVGLKNAGATCYMNSVLQQLFCVPGICEQLLATTFGNAEEEDSIFYQLQNVFGHLQESKLMYYEPEKFWQCLRLFGQPVNVREQQDAFEFFTQIVDQVDEFLTKNKKPKLFSNKFEGVFSDQKICQGCPHIYDREEAFMALNLTVKVNSLQESLDQFVKGELLDGDNAYFCEECKVKRNTIKRMCVRTLPPTLIIQLKRFHYDWETNRALKFDDFFRFPWTLDMTPYTEEGIKAAESGGSGNVKSEANRYQLVGIVVHSGQANAGHYYSYIKQRKSAAASPDGKSSNKWFKFNDTTVEEFDMNDDTLATECFGGTYKEKSSNSSLPEKRQRYWNAYMLFYESEGPLTSQRPVTKKSQSQSQQNRLPSRLSVGATSRTSEPPSVAYGARESLSQLSDLLERGEKKGLFYSRMPPSIERGIQEENLKFLENRDVFSDEYYRFVLEFLSANLHGIKVRMHREDFSTSCRESIRLAVHFLLNSYLHLRERQNSYIKDMIDTIDDLLSQDLLTTQWIISFLATDGLAFMKPCLLECTFREVRLHFANLLYISLASYEKHTGTTAIEEIDRILSHLVDLVENDVPNNCKISGQFFWLLSRFAQMGTKQCGQLFEVNLFPQLIKFLLGVDVEPQQDFNANKHRRRWGTTQTKEFGELHSLLAHLVLACSNKGRADPDGNFLQFSSRLQARKADVVPPTPESVSRVLNGPITSVFVREIVSACREVTFGFDEILAMLVTVSRNRPAFSKLLLKEVMQQYSTSNSGELRNLSTVLVELLAIEDDLQSERIGYVVEGDHTLNVEGLLAMVKKHQTSDSCRAYQCIKTLVNSSNKSAVVKEYLLQNATQWQWSVNWLQSKMSSENFNGSQWSPTASGSIISGADSASDSGQIGTFTNPTSIMSSGVILSNEDSATRTFHRTTSAQVTLEEANAILAEFGGSLGATTEANMEMDDDDDDDAFQAPDDEMPELQEVNDESR